MSGQNSSVGHLSSRHRTRTQLLFSGARGSIPSGWMLLLSQVAHPIKQPCENYSTTKSSGGVRGGLLLPSNKSTIPC